MTARGAVGSGPCNARGDDPVAVMVAIMPILVHAENREQSIDLYRASG